MADGPGLDLPYGHFGRAEYGLEDGTWRAVRRLDAPQLLRALGPTTHAVTGDRTLLDERSASDGPLSKRLAKQVRTTIGLHPELLPASGLLPQRLRVSEAVPAAVYRYDSSQGSLLDFTARWPLPRRHTTRMAAVASGETASTVCFIPVRTHKLGWSGCEAACLETPTLRSNVAFRLTTSESIRQIKFAESNSRGDVLLAVRCTNHTLIFRPVAGDQDSLGKSAAGAPLGYSYTVSTSDSGAVPHADVAFNPGHPNQIGVIDQNGQWQVLMFRSRKLDGVEKVWSSDTTPSPSRSGRRMNDGFARIAWVFNERTVAVCSRHEVILFGITTEKPEVLATLDPGLSGVVPWIVDFAVIPGQAEWFCVLTTTHIVLYDVIPAGFENITARMKLRLRHFKDPEDLTLRISTWADEEDIVLILRSNLTTTVSSYRMRLKDQADHVAVSEPSEFFESLDAGEHLSTRSTMIDLHMEKGTLAWSSIALRQERNVPAFLRHRIQFYVLMSLEKDLSVVERLCYALTAGSDPVEVPVPTQGSRGDLTERFLRKRTFVVDDGVSDSDDEGSQITHEPVPRHVRRIPRAATSDRRVPSMEEIAGELVLPSETQPLETIISDLRSTLSAFDSSRPLTLRLLVDHPGLDPAIADVEEASSTFRELVNLEVDRPDPQEGPECQEMQSLMLRIRPIPLPQTLELDCLGAGTSMSSIYGSTVAAWITSLAESIPGRVRLAKEKLARHVAAKLVLASHALCVEEKPKPPTPEEARSETQDTLGSWELPMRSGIPGSFADAHAKPPHLSAPLTPSPTATPSVTAVSSYSSGHAAPELNRLSRYTVFERPAPSVLPRSLSNVLSHWTVGADPADYDWLSTSRHITQKDEEAEDDGTEKEKRRISRHAERALRRERTEAAASRARRLTSSQAPEVFTASQPAILKTETQPMGTFGSSQVQAPGPASQVVPGRFGGRPPARKKRKSGF